MGVDPDGLDMKRARHAKRTGDRAVGALGLGLNRLGLSPISIDIEVEDPVVWPVVAPARACDVVDDVGGIDGCRLGRVRQPAVVFGFVMETAELQLVPVGRAQVELADLGRGIDVAVDDHVAVASL